MEDSVESSLSESSGDEVDRPRRSVKKQKVQSNMVKNKPKAAAGKTPTPSDQEIYTGEGEEESDLDNWCETFSSECRELWKPWRRALILKVLDMPGYSNFKPLQQKILKLWSLSKGCELKELGGKYLTARFYSKDDYEDVLENIPWMIIARKRDCYLAITKWRPNFKTSIDPGLMYPTFIWVRVLKLPIEFRTEDMLLEIGNALGKSIEIDDTSSETLRKGHAYIGVEIDFTKPLVPIVEVNGQNVEVQYMDLEFIHICDECHMYGYMYKRYADCCSLGLSKK